MVEQRRPKLLIKLSSEAVQLLQPSDKPRVFPSQHLRFFRFQYNNLALNYSLKSLLYNTKMVGCVPYRPLYIYATSGRNLKSIRRIPQNQTFRFYLSLPVPRFPICQKTGDACPVRRGFGDLAFPQGEELIPHIDILLSSPGKHQTAWMMHFLFFGMSALPCQAVAYRE